MVRAILACDGPAAYAAMRDHNARLSSRVLERLAHTPRAAATAH